MIKKLNSNAKNGESLFFVMTYDPVGRDVEYPVWAKTDAEAMKKFRENISKTAPVDMVRPAA